MSGAFLDRDLFVVSQCDILIEKRRDSVIPEYLRSIARETKIKGDRSTCELVCPCGNQRFHVFHNKFTEEEKAVYDQYWSEYEKAFRGGYASMCTRDSNGKLHHWKIVVPGIKIEVFPPEDPPFPTVFSWRVGCSACGQEYLIFDSRLHGYDGIFCTEEKDRNYAPRYVQRMFRDKAPIRIELTTENDSTLEQFRENTGVECGYEAYSNAFGWISIQAVDENGKKTKLLDHETA